MKVLDSIKESIYTYPLLYLSDNFEESKWSVLNHYFITLGSGEEWANTKNPKQGGYLCEATYSKRRIDDGYHKRIYDLPYGKKTFDIDIAPLFKERQWEWRDDSVKLGYPPKKESYILSETELKSKYPNVKIHFYEHLGMRSLGTAKIDNKTEFWCVTEKRAKIPYPYFEKTHSCFWEKGVEYIQDDWRIAALDHLGSIVEFFNDENQYKNYHHYPTPLALKELEEYITKQKYTVEGVRKDYEFPNFDGGNFEEMQQYRWNKELASTKEFLEETIDRLLTI